jgi:hypothetical protein
MVVGYVLFILWKLRGFFAMRLVPQDMRATAMYQAIKDPDADERILLHKKFTGAMVVGQSFKRFLPSVILVALLIAAPVMYVWGPGINGPFGVYDITMPVIEDTYVTSASLKFVAGELPFLRIGNVYGFERLLFTDDTAYGFLRVPRPDEIQNVSLFEVGMFKWLGISSYSSPNGSNILACPINLNWEQDTFNFVEFSLQVDESLGGGVFCSGTFVPDGLIGWVWWNMTGIMGTNDTIMFLQYPTLKNSYHIFDSTEAERSPMIRVIYEGIGPEERPLWIYGLYIAGVLIVGQVAIWQLKKRKRAKAKKKGNIR